MNILKITKNQRGHAHLAILFIFVFACIGAVGLAVSHASPLNKTVKVSGYVSLGNRVYGGVSGYATRNPKPGEAVTAQTYAFKTNVRGDFSVKLVPGSYTFKVTPRTTSPVTTCKAVTQTVRRAPYQRVIVRCQPTPAPTPSTVVSFQAVKSGTDGPTSGAQSKYSYTWDSNKLTVYAGTKKTGGYEIAVAGITKKGTTYTVRTRETKPGPTCVVTQALTNPYQTVILGETSIPAGSKFVMTSVSTVVHNC